MNITINAYWFYGYIAHELGECKYDNDARRSKFHWRHGQEYDSPWLACLALNSELRNRCGFIDDLVFAGAIGGESVVGIKIEADTGILNMAPDEDFLADAKANITECLNKVGFVDLPNPKLYFMVTTEESDAH